MLCRVVHGHEGEVTGLTKVARVIEAVTDKETAAGGPGVWCAVLQLGQGPGSELAARAHPSVRVSGICGVDKSGSWSGPRDS